MLAQAAQFVTALSLVPAPKCATCKDTLVVNDPFSFGDTLPCECQSDDGLYNLRQFTALVEQHMTVTLLPADDDDRFDEVYYSQYQNGYEVGY